MSFRRLLFGAILSCAIGCCQKPEFDFYTEFRNAFSPKVRAANPTVTNEKILQEYALSLRAASVAEAEIARRVRLIQTERQALEIDMWNRVYSGTDNQFNRAPNQFLVETVQDRAPGVALDYGMGEGRNAIYLAQQGWRVYGFDPSEAGVALARKRAQQLGLVLDLLAVPDAEYPFGKERFDLILFSWSMPLVPVERVIDALKPGGMIVMECAENYVGRNGMLKMFDGLRITSYQIVKAKADWYNRMETEIVRLVAVKAAN